VQNTKSDFKKSKGFFMKKIFLMLMLIGNSFFIRAMNKDEREAVYDVPAKANQVLHEVPKEQMLSIKCEDELSDQGIINDLVIRPQVEKRKVVESLKLTVLGAEGDKNYSRENDRELTAVTLMRTDVSAALGGAYVPGDTIHVTGLRMGKKYISPGDIFVIAKGQEIKSILLKTYASHYACWKLKARCGQIAFDFLNSGGDYEDGCNTPRGIINGINDCLRGHTLVVLKEGEVAKGDTIFIERAEHKEKRLQTMGLTQLAQKWLQASEAPAEKYEKKFQFIMQNEKKQYLKKKTSSIS
jgi:hypothetical protein